MPRKKNNRKAIQNGVRDAEPKPKTRDIGTIAHVGMGGHGLAMAVLASGIMRSAERTAVEYDVLHSEETI
jgi:hypothetical protein